MRGIVGVACCALSFSLAARVAAAAPPVTPFEWDAPAGCPDVKAVSERLAALRGDEPLDDEALENVRGVIRREGQGWQLTLEVFDGGEIESRLIAADDCQHLADAAAVAIVLAFSGGVETAAGTGAAPPTSDVTPADPPSEAAQRSAPLARLLAQAVLDTATLPRAAFGVGAELRVVLSWLALGTYGAWLPSQNDYVRSARFVEFGLWFAGLRACAALFRSAVEAVACAGVDVGALHAEGSGLFRSNRTTDPWLAPMAGLELTAPLWHKLGVSARSELAFPLVRRPYVINEAERIHRPPVLVPRVWLGLAWAFE
jgi:hypothetical protein